jgi:hypothetical protein
MTFKDKHINVWLNIKRVQTRCGGSHSATWEAEIGRITFWGQPAPLVRTYFNQQTSNGSIYLLSQLP